MPDTFRAFQQSYALGSQFYTGTSHGCPCCITGPLRRHKRRSIRKARRADAALWLSDYNHEVSSDIEAAWQARCDEAYAKWEMETQMDDMLSEYEYEMSYKYQRDDWWHDHDERGEDEGYAQYEDYYLFGIYLDRNRQVAAWLNGTYSHVNDWDYDVYDWYYGYETTIEQDIAEFHDYLDELEEMKTAFTAPEPSLTLHHNRKNP